jgi:hypothetical protein
MMTNQDRLAVHNARHLVNKLESRARHTIKPVSLGK